ncbi:MAG: MinD/ParA family protein [Sedimentisphaerales bacterium]|nr:MinD/ParA family protein [Sedimentisphaerales bacterium]
MIENKNNNTIVDQAEKLRLMVQTTRKSARVVAVTSGKGGVGKTNVAANLAICLAAANRDVILVDADLGLANLDVVLNLNPRHNLSDVICGSRRMDEIIRSGPGGIRIVCGASGLSQLADLNEFQRQRVIQEISTLEHQADVIVIDTGAGISRDVCAFCEAADHTVVVTTPDPTSITDAYAMIKRITRANTGSKISLLVNVVESRGEAKKVFQRLNATSQKFLDVPLYDAGYVLRDEHVVQAVRRREPVVLAYPRCQASYCMLALAGKLGRAGQAAAAQEGFFRKVVNWFF